MGLRYTRNQVSPLHCALSSRLCGSLVPLNGRKRKLLVAVAITDHRTAGMWHSHTFISLCYVYF